MVTKIVIRQSRDRTWSRTITAGNRSMQDIWYLANTHIHAWQRMQGINKDRQASKGFVGSVIHQWRSIK